MFVPLMLAQDTEGHIVNNASVAGLLPFHPCAAYQVTKHAVVALSEQLYFSLAARHAKVHTSVLCTGFVKTRIMDAERNRPAEFMNEPDVPMISQWQAVIPDFRQAVEAGMSPQQVADEVFEAIHREQFYILTHPEYNLGIQQRVENIVNGRNPA